jgi:hypothetical protein
LSRFEATIGPIDAGIQARMSSSWRPGCPVPLHDLRLLTLSHWGFDRAVHQGELVVHRQVASDVVRVFGILFRARFPIQRMVLIDAFAGDDCRSMAANNTSAFNYRLATDRTDLSRHSYGLAIDINPLLNPYITSDGTVLPPAGARYADRSLDELGMIHADDLVVRAFVSIGWEWGGYRSSFKDYQHFSATPR